MAGSQSVRSHTVRVAKSGAAKLLRAARRIAWLTLRLACRISGGPRSGDRVRVRILMQHAYGMGGTIRTTLNLAGHLAQSYDVEIVSVVRARDEPFFAIPPGVRVTFADDRRPGQAGRLQKLLSRLPSLLTPPRDSTYRDASCYTDLQLAKILFSGGPQVLIGTRPALNLLIAEVGSPSVVKVGQDHGHLDGYRPWLYRSIKKSYPRLDALSVLTAASLRAYADLLDGTAVRLTFIPNAVPPLGGGMADRRAKTIVTAGRMVKMKGFDLLVEAFAEVVEAHPDWKLKIFGTGRELGPLRELVAGMGLAETVKLPGRTAKWGEELAKASICAVSSRSEGFSMVILEAMSKGVPTVSFDCPTGPAELITPGEDGVLVPNGDVPGLAAGLRTLIEDTGLRDRLGEQARRSAGGYDLKVIGAQWEELIDDLVPPRLGAAPEHG